MPRYQVVANYDKGAGKYLLCWGGWTGDRELAEQRLAEAREHTEKRKAAGGKGDTEWTIHERS